MIISILLTAIVLWIVIQHYRRVSRLPPGPFSLPILGNIPMIFYYAWRAGGVVPMMSMMKRKYGNVFTIWIGTIPHVSVTDFETCHEVFAKSGNRFSDKAFSPIFNEARNGFGMIAINGSIWQEMRRFSLQTFRNMGIGKDLMELRIMSELDLRCREIDEESIDGVTEVNATEFFDLIAGSIINTLPIGSRFEKGNSHHFLRLKMLIEESTKVLSPIDVMLPIWFLKIFLKRRYSLVMKAHRDILDFLAKDAIQRVEDVLNGKIEINPENPADYIDSFILKILQKDSDKNTFSILSLKSVLTDLWIAGQETTATTLVSGFCQLLNHPNVMEKIRNELLHVVGSRPLTLKDKSETPYLNAVIAEIQRHASILNINFFKINHEVTEIGGHPVDAGALVTAQLSSLHSDETTYSNPNVFDPEKFVNDKNLSQKLIPFGIGKRACTGEALARAELYLIIGNLLLRYKFQPSGPLVSNIDDAPYSFAKKPRGYKMQLIKI
ncbi:Protein CBG11454 [Caenorhabditis briggsae]|uniref:CYtochrome P450 family n=2 Tax=Caenorhabditis briggsae TaxID=6238 RepID=A0AAE9CWV4_CAEBR|nr:Protein CBG11454 [Caenorhabditis briggsae]ULT85860.1 hypothetical protein L3Y34_005917 [Caenorhabditis briggsae]CAP30512.1 Protein CBG11454 [Caenorhabditis briggsae]